jgi:hypothetical protein
VETTFETRERFAVAYADPADVRPTAHDSLFAGEDRIEEHRWWTLGELERTTDDRAPRRFPELLRDLLDHGPPAAPVDAGR